MLLGKGDNLSWHSLMRLVQAGVVVAEHLDDAAFGDTAVLAFLDHALDLAAQGGEAGDLLVDIGEMQPGDRIDITAGAVRLVGEIEQLADRLDCEAEIAGMADEAQPLDRRAVIGPPVAVGPIGDRQQADILIVADGGNLDAGRLGDGADRNRAHGEFPA